MRFGIHHASTCATNGWRRTAHTNFNPFHFKISSRTLQSRFTSISKGDTVSTKHLKTLLDSKASEFKIFGRQLNFWHLQLGINERAPFWKKPCWQKCSDMKPIQCRPLTARKHTSSLSFFRGYQFGKHFNHDVKCCSDAETELLMP